MIDHESAICLYVGARLLRFNGAQMADDKNQKTLATALVTSMEDVEFIP